MYCDYEVVDITEILYNKLKQLGILLKFYYRPMIDFKMIFLFWHYWIPLILSVSF